MTFYPNLPITTVNGLDSNVAAPNSETIPEQEEALTEPLQINIAPVSNVPTTMAMDIDSQDEEEDPEYRPSSGDSSSDSDESYIDMNIDPTEVDDVEDIHKSQVTDTHENIVTLPSIVSHKNIVLPKKGL